VQVAILLFDNVVITEALGPYEVLHRLPNMSVSFVGLSRGLVWDRKHALALNVDATLEDVSDPDVLVVPGGLGEFRLLHEKRLLDWVCAVHDDSLWTTSVGLGSLLLARAGILEGVEATTHWAFQDELAKLGAIPVNERVVERGKLLTAAGCTAGFDMALVLAERLADPVTAAAVQLWIEYDPEPPFDSGSLAKATGDVIARATELLDS
jgi:putative intracellular protease/amidase